MNHRPCISRHPVPRPATCGFCHAFVTKPEFAKRWGGGEQSAKMVAPPILKPFTGPVNSPLALVTLSIGPVGRDLLDIAGPIFERYAAWIGADYHVIRVESSPWPCGEKWRVHSYFPHYERILWLDADIILSPHCPNLFDVVPRGMIGWHVDCPRPGAPWNQDTEWIMREYLDVIRSQGWPEFQPPNIAWNSGVYVADREHAEIFAPAKLPVPHYHCSEQWHETLLAYQRKTPIFELPTSLNYQWWFDQRRPLTTPVEGVRVYHFAGMKSHQERVRQMLAMRAALYPGERFATPIIPRGECPELGRPLRNDELIPLNIDPATCGCRNKVRQCNLHGHCTTAQPRDGMRCCATCNDHPDAK